MKPNQNFVPVGHKAKREVVKSADTGARGNPEAAIRARRTTARLRAGSSPALPMPITRSSSRVKSAQKAVAEVAVALSQRRKGESIEIERRFPGGHLRVFAGEIVIEKGDR